MEVNRQDAKSAKGEILPAEWINRYGRHERNEEMHLSPMSFFTELPPEANRQKDLTAKTPRAPRMRNANRQKDYRQDAKSAKDEECQPAKGFTAKTPSEAMPMFFKSFFAPFASWR